MMIDVLISLIVVIILQCLFFQNIMMYILNIYKFCPSYFNKAGERMICCQEMSGLGLIYWMGLGE